MKLFIGCSSSNDIPKEYLDDSKELLEELMKANDLVFGASNAGLMGLSHNVALSHNRSVIGICPVAYKDDFKNLKCTQEIITKTVSERTEGLIRESDVLIFLPGGIGTIYELFSSIESKRCHEFNKPIIIYNSNNFYDILLEFMNKMYNEKFVKEKDKDNYVIMNTKEEVITYLESYEKNLSMD